MPTDILTPAQVAEIKARQLRYMNHVCLSDDDTALEFHSTSACTDASALVADSIPALLASHAALAERVAALEDAERIAWALAHVGFDIPCYITWSRAASEWCLTTPFTDADRAAGLMGNVRYHWLGSGKAPRLTPDARAAIDAARKEKP